MGKFVDLTGQRFGKLLVLGRAPEDTAEANHVGASYATAATRRWFLAPLYVGAIRGPAVACGKTLP
jgi:hypothetical protein